LVYDPEFVVGDEDGDLDDDVARRLEAGHLEVHPSEHARRCYRCRSEVPAFRARRSELRASFLAWSPSRSTSSTPPSLFRAMRNPGTPAPTFTHVRTPTWLTNEDDWHHGRFA